MTHAGQVCLATSSRGGEVLGEEGCNDDDDDGVGAGGDLKACADRLDNDDPELSVISVRPASESISEMHSRNPDLSIPHFLALWRRSHLLWTVRSVISSQVPRAGCT